MQADSADFTPIVMFASVPSVTKYSSQTASTLHFSSKHRSQMPELPEVEVTLRGVTPHIQGRTVQTVVLRRSGLRWPFPPTLPAMLAGRVVERTARRGKYLLLHFAHGTLIIHLGMSGTCGCCRRAYRRKNMTISTWWSMDSPVLVSKARKCCA